MRGREVSLTLIEIGQQHRTVLFQEVDAAGIVFYSRIFDWFHDAYFAHLAAHGIDVPHVLATDAWAGPLVHAEADYHRPFRFGDRITVQMLSVKLGGTALTIEYRIVDGEAATDSGDFNYTLQALIDALSRRRKTASSPRALEAGPFKVKQSGSSARR